MALSLLANQLAPVVIDASVAINLNASGIGEAILRAIPNTTFICDIALTEVRDDRRSGRADATLTGTLISAQVLRVVPLSDAAELEFEKLVVGPASETLDDGEAATLALALSMGGIATLDERKGHRLARERYPTLIVSWTAELFAYPKVQELLGRDQLAEGVFRSLRDARMRVPDSHVQWVVDLIGVDRAAECLSLPLRYRRPIRD